MKKASPGGSSHPGFFDKEYRIWELIKLAKDPEALRALSKMMRWLFGPALTTDDITRRDEILDMIQHATAEAQCSVDWGAVVSTVAMVNSVSNEAILSAVCLRLRQRLDRGVASVVMNALTLTDFLIQHCHEKFHEQLATKDFSETMVKLLQPPKDMGAHDAAQIREKARELIRLWAEAFAQDVRTDDKSVSAKDSLDFLSYHHDRSHPVAALEYTPGFVAAILPDVSFSARSGKACLK